MPPQERDRLLALTDDTSFDVRDVVYRAGRPMPYVYFPLAGVFSKIIVMEDGAMVEVGTVGSEGMVGLGVFHDADRSETEVICQVVPCQVRRMPAEAFKKEAHRPGPLQSAVRRYAQVYLTQVSRTAACNRMHSIEERLARWLLMTQDRVGADTFGLTQEFLSMMLGVRRPSVSIAAGMLQKAGLISYVRGRVTVLDRAGLESAACECYRLTRDDLDRLLP